MATERSVLSHRRMASALLVVVCVLAFTAVLGDQAVTETPKSICSAQTATTGISVSVDPKTKKVSFVCDKDMNKVLPSDEDNHVTKCYTKKELEGDVDELVRLFGEGTTAVITTSTAEASQNSELTLTVGTLPMKTNIIYFYCTTSAEDSDSVTESTPSGTTPGPVSAHGGPPVPPPAAAAVSGVRNTSKDSSVLPTGIVGLVGGVRRLMVVDDKQDKALSRSTTLEKGETVTPTQPKAKCLVTVTVPADPDAQTCTPAKQSMNLEITEKSKSAAFQCDTDISALSPDVGSKLIFDERCQKEVNLTEVIASAKVQTTDIGYAFSVEELPDTAQAFCYKCSTATANTEANAPNENACFVKIKVSAANKDSAASASATTGSVSALSIGIVTSFFVTATVL
ncbi:SAG-related sequence SRS53B [Toxoplasma gondii RUB]|uniref:SAG-related sequence SRS53B n=4 Tax=Toxoplasma gondii TaxID=5811 RepID=A0A086MBP9_TOXGO|nr:SAG-related sequence SRS53B [Toxoplasma gondii FOU]KFG66317.1 SAG-related sequence SRS53B [Toxoplasma gondii RUB]KFH02136.1 SAG-related sequence SRS53B [Toxoplasma gondii VAND]PUA86608.1 SAG-related sequence SRS53B [Toxoplasma gondii TgCATBr9]